MLRDLAYFAARHTRRPRSRELSRNGPRVRNGDASTLIGVNLGSPIVNRR